MEVWKRVRFLKKTKKIDMIAKSYVNYIYANSPMTEIINKYHIEPNDVLRLNQHLADRIAGLTVLTLADDKERLKNIITKYDNNQLLVGDIVPEIEGFVDIK